MTRARSTTGCCSASKAPCPRLNCITSAPGCKAASWPRPRRGELAVRLPVGLVYDAAGQVALDPDTGVRRAVAHLFATFEATGSASAVVKAFAARRPHLPRSPPHRRARRRAVLEAAAARPRAVRAAQPALCRRVLLRAAPTRQRRRRPPAHLRQTGRRMDHPDPRRAPRLHQLGTVPSQPGPVGRQRPGPRARPPRRPAPRRPRPAAGPAHVRQVRRPDDRRLPHPRRRQPRPGLHLPTRSHRHRHAALPEHVRLRHRRRRRPSSCSPPSPRWPCRPR